MRSRLLLLSLTLVLAASSLEAQSVKTGNQYVSATVEPLTGLITIRKAPGTALDPLLSAPQKSFCYVMVGDRIFTNNNVGVNITNDPRYGGFLSNGVNQKLGDTIRTTWSNKNGCDIIQDVFPVTLDASGQIVMLWKVKNNSNVPVWGQAQFLLDLAVGAQNPNDVAPVLTRYGYRPIWEQYDPASTYGIPWFYVCAEKKLPNAPTFDPGVTAVGYTQDVNYTLGLKRPLRMNVGDWGNPLGSALVDNLWGPPTSAPWGQSYVDPAMLLEWDGVGVPIGRTLEVARTSYGSGEFGVCTGQLFGLVFYPRRFHWNLAKFQPETATVEFYAYDVYSPLPQDPNYGPPSSNTYATLHAGPGIRILKPDTMNTNQKHQRQQMGPAAGYIPQYGVGTASWNIVADKQTNCSQDLTSWLKLTAESSLDETGPIFTPVDTCEHPVIIDCSIIDTLPPIFRFNDSSIVSGAHVKSFYVRDNRPSDKGVKTVSGISTPGFDLVISVSPSNWQPCYFDSLLVKVTQTDSTKEGCLDVKITDCADNDTIMRVCFAAHPYIAPVDTIPPVITIDSTNKRWIRINFSDKGANDWGMDTLNIEPMPGTNPTKFTMGIVSPAPDSCSKRQHAYTIKQLDTNFTGCFIISGVDCAGNHTPTYKYCFPQPQLGVELTSEEDGIDLIGNPASDRSILRVGLTKSQSVTVRVIDISGREVAVHEVSLAPGSNDVPIQTTDLAEGTYYVVAEWSGRQYAKKLQVVK